MNGRSHDDIERLVREVQQFEPCEEETKLPLWQAFLPIIVGGAIVVFGGIWWVVYG